MLDRSKNLLKTSLLTFFLTSVTLSIFGQTSFKEAKASGRANVTYAYNNVYGFIDNTSGEVEGLLVDLIREFESYVLRKEGITINSVFKYTNDDF